MRRLLHKHSRSLGLFIATLSAAAPASALLGCDAQEALCADWSCSGDGLLQGNASISGDASIDSFFSAVLSVRDASTSVNASIKVEFASLAGKLGIAVEGMSTAQIAAAISTHVETNLNVHLAAKAKLEFQPPKCEADVELVAKASAECDASVQPGSVNVQCKGGCDIEASVEAEAKCTGPDLKLTCQGQAPELVCEGSCTGSCQLELAAECSGTCTGTCNGECSACAGGNCEEENGVITNCTGTCMGSCQGTCELSAGGSCSGKCEGSCEWEPGMASCTASGAQPHCEVRANAQASIECQAKCEGEVIPPQVKAECKASVEAKAKAEVTCTPPQITLSLQFNAGVDATVKAQVRSQFNVLHAHYGKILAAYRKNEIVVAASVDLIAEAGGAVSQAIDIAIDAAESGEADLQVIAGLGCATQEIKAVGTVMGKVGSDAQVNADAMASIRGVLQESRI